jgi:exodeoxyribonuclease VII large subunit
LPVTLFASDKDAINWKLRRSGAGRMSDGTEVRIRGVVSHYASRGTVQLRMTWIDPDFTLGRLAAIREAMIRALAAEGLLEANRARPMPAVPLRVGLVTSAGSAAHADFLHELAASGYAWNVTAYDVRVQGAEAPASVAAAIRAIAGRVEVVAVVRGGGAQTELATFDDEAVARAIAACPVPVITGIGHEVDMTVADRVAHAAYKTPTAAASGLVAQVRRFTEALSAVALRAAGATGRAMHRAEVGVDHAARRIVREAALAVRRSGEGLARAERRLVTGSTRSAGAADRVLSTLAERLVGVGMSRAVAGAAHVEHLDARLARSAAAPAARAVHKLDLAQARIDAADPTRVLARGFSLVRDATGRAVTSAARLRPGDPLTVEFGDGTVAARVEHVERGERSASPIAPPH